MRKILIMLLLITFIFPNMKALATIGQLKSNSICNSGDNNYGFHADGHWHNAVLRDGKWYPDGDSLGYDNPCITYTNKQVITSDFKDTTKPVGNAKKKELKIQMNSNATITLTRQDITAFDLDKFLMTNGIKVLDQDNQVIPSNQLTYKIDESARQITLIYAKDSETVTKDIKYVLEGNEPINKTNKIILINLVIILILELVVFLIVNRFQITHLSTFNKTYFFYVFGGVFGLHRFANKKKVTGALMLLTLGGFFIWFIIDGIILLVASARTQVDLLSYKTINFNTVLLTLFLILNIVLFFNNL